MSATIGRIVHYVSYGTPGGEFPSVCRAAVVSAVEELPNVRAEDRESLPNQPVDLVVLNPEGLFFNHGVTYDEDHAGGTWHWPERAPEQ